MLTLYYGLGKGKTNCAIGSAVRTAMKDKKVLFVEFIRQDDLSDKKALETMYTITVMSAPVDMFLNDDALLENKAQISKVFRELFDSALRTVLTQNYDMIVLDGVFDAIDNSLLLESEVYDFLSNAPDSLEIVCTGVQVNEKFLSLATTATNLTDKTIIT